MAVVSEMETIMTKVYDLLAADADVLSYVPLANIVMWSGNILPRPSINIMPSRGTGHYDAPARLSRLYMIDIEIITNAVDTDRTALKIEQAIDDVITKQDNCSFSTGSDRYDLYPRLADKSYATDIAKNTKTVVLTYTYKYNTKN